MAKGSPIQLWYKRDPKYEGLGYGEKEFGECSKRLEAQQSSEDDMSHQDGGDNVHLSPNQNECFKGPCMSSSTPLS